MGPSGSGKSTFLTCAAGLERPTGGRVLVAGEDVTDWSERRRTRLRRDRIGFVFQGFHLLPYLTAEQNVGLPLRLAGGRLDRRRVRDLLDRVGLGDRAGHLPAQLSGGQQQRVAIARALVTDPAVVLADEPTGALDSTHAREVLALLRTSVDALGQTVVMVTHDPVAASYADRWCSSSTAGSPAGWTAPPPTPWPARWPTSTSSPRAVASMTAPGPAVAAAPRDRVHRDLPLAPARHRDDRLVRHAGRDRRRPVSAADAETLIIMGAVVGGWGTLIVLFSVASTLGITVRQRDVEIGLLRTIGGTPRQARRLIRVEALVGRAVAAVARAPWSRGSAGAPCSPRSATAAWSPTPWTYAGGPASLGPPPSAWCSTSLVAAGDRRPPGHPRPGHPGARRGRDRRRPDALVAGRRRRCC